jgi:uncharacterized tellurite resistance protein B-like protein
MSQEFLEDRKRSLEEAFFAKQNQALVERLRTQKEREERTSAVQQASGIEDPELLARLVDLGLGADTIAALSLVPLIEVAWADGDVHPKERQAVLKAAAESGVEAGSSAAALLDSWLEQKPDPALLEAWKQFVRSLSSELAPDARRALRDDVLGRAERVAAAAGGLLGAAAISGKERDKLYELDHAFA